MREIQESVRRLSLSELHTFRAWFAEFDAQVWDRQIEEDASTGRLDRLADEALKGHLPERRNSRFVLSASVFLHRDGEILILKRAGGYAGGGWFIPGGHIEFGETPLQAAVRETVEEAGIELDPATLRLVDVTTFYPEPDVQHHGFIYLAACPPGVECVLNEEHTGFRWVTPEYYCQRFLDEERMRALGIGEDLILTTRETRRVTEAVMRALAQLATAPQIAP